VSRKRTNARLTLAGCAFAVVGCQTTSITPAPHRVAIRAAPLRTADVSAGVLPLGSVPYDNRSLPLVSPDGRFVATQTGDPPAWETLLAGPEAPVPVSTRIEIYQIDRARGRTVFDRSLKQPLLLGRAGDAGGFLVESPRPDGARWIGYASWSGGSVEWLVADERVNAFGSLGPGRRLAWSRRAQDADHFDLVIRAAGDEWTVGSQGGDWLLPVWSAGGQGVFALRLDGGELELAHMFADSPASARQTIQRLRLATNMTSHHAYQCVASQALLTGVAAPGETHLLFWHPAAGRIALWRPLSSPGAAVLLEPDSMAAVVDPSGLALVATPRHLSVQRPSNIADRRTLLPGGHVPRPIDAADWPYVLLAPGRDRIGLMALRVVRESHQPSGVMSDE
jgi:hypothetical protein